MWALRILNGPQAGQVFPLPNGKIRVGRSASCQIRIESPGISKEHLEINILPEKMMVQDLRSANGTFLNGMRIQHGLLKLGDKLLISQIMFDIVLMQERSLNTLRPIDASQTSNHLPAPMGTGAIEPAGGEFTYQPSNPTAPAAQPPATLGGFFEYQSYRFNQMMEEKVLPAVYKLPQTFEFRFVLMGFVAVYILAVTLLSLVPLYEITSESISVESQRRALTVARALSEINQRVLRSGDLSGFRTDLVMKEEGIEDAYVVAADGKIMAPPERIGMTPKEAGFMTKIKRSTQEMTDKTMDGRVVASVPVVSFDGELQQNVARAYAVIVYNPGNLTFDDNRAFSLFVQVFTLALLIGAFLFFFLYKMIQYPFLRLHEALDTSIREGSDQIQIDFNFPAMQSLMTSINSLLTRVVQGGAAGQTVVGRGSRDTEIANIMELIGFPSILVSREGVVTKVSAKFLELTSIPPDKIEGVKVNDIPNPAMADTFNRAINGAQANISVISSEVLDLSGASFRLNCQAMANAQGDIEYFLLTVTDSQVEAA